LCNCFASFVILTCVKEHFMKLLFYFFVFSAPLFLQAQNVGIGTGTPGGRLQVNHRSGTQPGIKIVDSALNDAGVLMFQNVNFSKGMKLAGFTSTDFNNGQFLDIRSDSVITATFRGNGNVGIRNISPDYPLDVNGNINTTGNILVNGTDGVAGQVLMKNSAGNMAWQYPEQFRNMASFVTTGSTTWTVPANITRIKVELWGGGAGGNQSLSGGAGAYIMSVLTVSPAQVWNITVGDGGAINTNGNSTIFSRVASGITLTAGGGNANALVSTFSAAGTTSFFGMQGQSSRLGQVHYQRLGTTDYIFYQDADGASSPMTTNTGGKSGQTRFAADFSSSANYPGGDGAQPGGGGGLCNTTGGNGMLVIYW
jgi:hypothetical protein